MLLPRAASSVVTAATELLLLQGLTVYVLTLILTLPFWLLVTKGPSYWMLASAATLCLLVTGLGLYRYATHGEIRRREFGAIPRLLRILVFASPSHAIHGACLSLFAVTWLKMDGQYLIGDDEEKDMQRDKAFFFYFIQGWLFSCSILVLKLHQLAFGRASHRSRVSAMVEKAPDIGVLCALSVALGIVMRGALSSLWLCTTITLVVGDAFMRTILTERTRRADIVDYQAIPSFVNLVAANSVEECFKCFPLVIVNDQDVRPPVESGLVKMLPSSLQDRNVQEWWSSQRKLLRYEGSITGVNSSDFYVRLSNERFKYVLQMLYRCDALHEAAAFASKIRPLSFPLQSVRLRAFRTLALPGISVSNWEACMNACLDLLDAQSARLMCYLKVASPQVEPPRNSETGLDDTDAYLTAKPDETKEERQERMQRAKDLQWDLDHTPLSGRGWWRRAVWGSFAWEFDPIYEENVRRRKQVRGDFGSPTWLDRQFARNPETGLVPDLALMSAASETMVVLLKRHKAFSGLGSQDLAQVGELVTLTMQRAIDAGDACLPILEQAGLSSHMVYALVFCVERDLQMLKTS